MADAVRNGIALLTKATKSNDSLVCCGLDPDLSRFPAEIIAWGCSAERKTRLFLEAVVDVTASSVCAYKIQKAFFDSLVDGHTVLREITAYIQSNYPRIPVLLDCKIGDIDNTMAAYLRTAFELLEVDGIVVNPYMGDDVLQPLSALPNKIGVVLVKTSNRGANIVQEIETSDGRPLWKHVLDFVIHRWNGAGNLIPVLSADCAPGAHNIRMTLPEQMPIFVAGYGAQGGTATQVGPFLNSSATGVLVNSSRAILYPYQKEDTDWRSAILRRVREMRDDLNAERDQKRSISSQSMIGSVQASSARF